MQLFQLTAALLLWQTVSGQPITYCGPDPCLVPINGISCSELILNYRFLGSCCRLVDIPATGGCRVEVGGPGGANCAWVPFCGSCDPTGDSFCGREYRTDTDQECPALTYDALAIQSAWDENATSVPVFTPSGNESVAPSVFFAEPPTCPPTTAPVAVSPTNPPAPSSAVSIFSLFGAVVSATLCATLL